MTEARLHLRKLLLLALIACCSLVHADHSCSLGTSKFEVTWQTFDNDLAEVNWSHVVIHEDTIVNKPMKTALSGNSFQKSAVYCLNVDQDYVLMLDKESTRDIKICDNRVVKPGDLRYLRVTALGNCSFYDKSIDDDEISRSAHDDAIVNESDDILKQMVEMPPYVSVNTKISGYINTPSPSDIDVMLSIIAKAQGVDKTNVELAAFQPSTGIIKTRTRLSAQDPAEINQAYHRLFVTLTDSACSGRFSQDFRLSGVATFAGVTVLSTEISRQVERRVSSDDRKIQKLSDNNIWSIQEGKRSFDEMVSLLCFDHPQLQLRAGRFMRSGELIDVNNDVEVVYSRVVFSSAMTVLCLAVVVFLVMFSIVSVWKKKSVNKTEAEIGEMITSLRNCFHIK